MNLEPFYDLIPSYIECATDKTTSWIPRSGDTLKTSWPEQNSSGGKSHSTLRKHSSTLVHMASNKCGLELPGDHASLFTWKYLGFPGKVGNLFFGYTPPYLYPSAPRLICSGAIHVEWEDIWRYQIIKWLQVHPWKCPELSLHKLTWNKIIDYIPLDRSDVSPAKLFCSSDHIQSYMYISR